MRPAASPSPISTSRTSSAAALRPRSNSTTRTGWTLGAGLDFAFAPSWIARVEYRYADYGTYSYRPVVFPGFTENHKITDNTIRFGLAYKFF